ncbi:MAG: hypothetical protein C0631_11805 [Sedimenticola sp.]|nr:MAG: hypothetical protein C0631_11805 [Sedimenticola sp.]
MTAYAMKDSHFGESKCSGPALFLSLLCAFFGTLFILVSATPVGLVFWAAGIAAYLPCLLFARKKMHGPNTGAN